MSPPSFSMRCNIQRTFDFDPYLLPNRPAFTMAPSTLVPSAPGSDNKVADLTVISYEKLLRKDAAEAAR